MVNSVLANDVLWHASMSWLSQTQFIQNLITPLILKFPNWSERSAECYAMCIAALAQIGATPEISPDDWCRGLAELGGYDLIPSESKEHFIAKVVSDAGGDQVLRGTPKQMLIVLEELTSGCTPWDFDEWEEFARCAFADEESRSVLVLAIEVIIEALKFSIDSRLVAFDIQSIASHSPAKAFAYCMSWMTEFLAWTENAWPSPIEVKAMGYSYVPEASDPSELHELTISTMALLDPRYQGMRSSRLPMQHPFRFRLTNLGRGLPHGEKLGLNINRDGDLIGLFVSVQSVIEPTRSDSLPAASKSIKESAPSDKPSWVDTLELELDEAKRTVKRMCKPDKMFLPVQLPPAEWNLLCLLLKAGKNGTTRKELAEVLNTSDKAVSTRKSMLKDKLFSLDLKLPGKEFRLADVNANRR